MKVRQRCYLAIKSETIDPDEIACLLGMTFDRSQRRASKAEQPPRPVANTWVLDAPDDLGVDEQIPSLLDRIDPIAEDLRSLLERSDVDGVIEVVREFGHPEGQDEEDGRRGDLIKLRGQHQLLGFALEAEVLARLVRLGLSLDFDEYG